MSGLALILSQDHAALERMVESTASAGFSSNCVDDASVAEKLVASYAGDFDAFIIDLQAVTREHENIIQQIRTINPETRVIATSDRPDEVMLYDEGVMICHLDDLPAHLTQ